MPCNSCGSRVGYVAPKNQYLIKLNGPNVWYCKCRSCNFCHLGGIYNNHWYARNDLSNKTLQPKLPNQSHGGHYWVPDANRYHK